MHLIRKTSFLLDKNRSSLKKPDQVLYLKWNSVDLLLARFLAFDFLYLSNALRYNLALLINLLLLKYLDYFVNRISV